MLESAHAPFDIVPSNTVGIIRTMIDTMAQEGHSPVLIFHSPVLVLFTVQL